MGAKRWVWWVLPATLLIAGCTSGRTASDPPPTGAESRSAGSPTVPPPSTHLSAPGSGAATSRSATPTTRPTAPPVPVDQIPPGNPESWVPAGVPTTAPYREPGDVVPKFTRTMFQNSSDGALATARYYIDAQNWAVAVNDYTPVTIICDAKRCDLISKYFEMLRRKNQRSTSGFISTGAPIVFRAPKSSGGQWIVRLQVNAKSEIVVDRRTGRVVHKYPSDQTLTDLYMKWSGKVWRVQDDLVAN